MLEAVAQTPLEANVCRLANMRRRLEALRALGISLVDTEEALRFLNGDGNAIELIDAPLRDDPTFRPSPSRFSDGSWRVFYSAVDWPTAEAEIGYHVIKAAEGVPDATPTYFQCLECAVAGPNYDIREHAATWKFLTDPSESSYPKCQELAAEARRNKSSALQTFSARRPDGVNVPVFDRAALSDPKITGSAVVKSVGGRYLVERLTR
ncbi:MAG: RES family NAD+ phosphorylase [Alphaproteobacteria bacterium]|nr:RES family NAD+ phosphorylase [Alphaproteobacteria bacterium]